jgi:hypothetical protein
MDEGSGLKRITLALVLHVPPGHEMQFAIDPVRQPAQRRLIPATPGSQQLRDFRGVVRQLDRPS